MRKWLFQQQRESITQEEIRDTLNRINENENDEYLMDEPVIDEISTLSTRSSGYYYKSYNRTNAVNYAKKWANSFNPAYETLNRSRDCANFVSQCLRAGGGPMEGRGGYAWGTSSRNPNVMNCTNPRFSWFNARGLYHYLRYNGSNHPVGLHARPYWIDIVSQSKNQKLRKGDLVFLMSRNPKNIYPGGGRIASHAMIISTPASRTSNIRICAHSRARNDVAIGRLGYKEGAVNASLRWTGMYVDKIGVAR